MSSFFQAFLVQMPKSREPFQFSFQFSLQFLILEMNRVFCDE